MSSGPSREDVFNHLAIHICQTKTPARVAAGEFLVIEAQEMQHRGLQIVDMDGIGVGTLTKFAAEDHPLVEIGEDIVCLSSLLFRNS